jgi:hypothetical protein
MTTRNTSDWRSVLRETLAAQEGGEIEPLAAEDAVAMRRAVVARARASSPERSWPRPLAVAAMVLLMIAAGTGLGRRFDARNPAAAPSAEEAAPASDSQRQLQFATPGGTRIIWVFNPDLNLKAATR